jgi:hypothetical protein
MIGVARNTAARQAKGQFIEWATDIRLRAERTAGQLLKEMAAKGSGLCRKGRNRNEEN